MAKDQGDDPHSEANASGPMMMVRNSSEDHMHDDDIVCHVEKIAKDLGYDPKCEAKCEMPMMISRQTGVQNSSEACVGESGDGSMMISRQTGVQNSSETYDC
eukprot:855849-Karenia_brevis.AAC.1